ncbi:TraB/VirB10 family protein [Pseudogemmobacter hezensis]|uniref:TraB/VirB10 family protein n=1 Tax=Pseudogemmobacter hezensis TaxID=2737662 RepID=UPI0020A62749|nr:TraB/VirB10 family protein [Pseudogemmobacter hezensis]
MAEARKQKQWLILGIAGGVLLLIILFLGQVMNARRSAFQGIGSSGHVDETIIADRTSQASPELTWARQSRTEIERLSKTVTELTASVTALTESQKAEIEAIREQYDEVIVTQQAEIDALKTGDPGGAAAAAPPGAALGPNGENYGQEFITGGGRTAAPGRPGAGAAGSEAAVQPFGGGFAIDFSLTPLPEPPPAAPDDRSSSVHVLGSYIPAGSYAPAVVISGVDASTGVVSRDNPVPVLVRITGPAITAAGGAGAGRRIAITGCTVLGSAMGDLSSERVYVRLTTLTCLGKGDQVIETQVAGLVAGSGKAGVRGQVVSREGNLARSAALAGALGGFADAVSSAASIAGSNDGAETVGSVLAGAGTGMLGGAAGNAADRLAEYYIDRAEQYQPVVSLYAGTEVEVVFMEGVSLK